MSYEKATTNTSNDVRSTSRSYVYVNAPDLAVTQGEVRGTYNRNKTVTKGPDYPDWQSRLRSGTNATTPLVGYISLFTRSTPLVYRYASRSTNYIFGACVGDCYTPSFGTPTSSIDSRADNQARSKLLESYIDAMNTFRGGNFAAELRDTVRMMASPYKSFYKRTSTFVGKVGKLKKVYKQDPERYGKALGDAWLGYSFGVKPLVGDLNDLSDAIRKMSEGSFYEGRVPINGTGRERSQSAQTIGGLASITPLSGPNRFTELTTITSSSVFYDAVIRARCGVGTLPQEFGVDVFDILPAVWEAVPWSFLVDYILNVGEALDSLRYANANVAWAKRTIRNSVALHYGEPRFIEDADLEISVSGGSCHTLRTYVQRTPLTILPYPQLHFKLPGFPSLKWANVAALTASIRASKPFTSDKFFQL